MNQKPLLVGAKIDAPFLNPCVFDRPSDTCNNRTGVNFELFDAVMSAMGRKYKLVRADENDSGYRDTNGTWRGLLGQLMKREIDMTVNLLAMEQRDGIDDFDYSAPATYYLKAFLIQKPDPNEATVSPWFLATTFKPLVWVCFLSVLFTYVFLLFAARVLAVHKSERRTWQYFSDSVVDVIRSPLGQTEPWPYVTPLRLTLNYMNVPIFVLMNFYTAYLTGSLMILGQPQDPFTGINQLSKLVYDNKFTLIRWKENARLFKMIPNTSYSEDPEDLISIATTWNPPVPAGSIAEAVSMVANNKSLVLRGSYEQLMHASAFSCRTKLIEDRDTVPTSLAFAFRKNDPLMGLVSKSLYDSALVERFLKSAYKKYLRHRECDDEMVKKPKFFALGLKQLQYGYYLLFYGFLVAIPFLVIEYFAPKLYKLYKRIFKSKIICEPSPSMSATHSCTRNIDVNYLWQNTHQLSPASQYQLFRIRRGSNASNWGF